MTELHIFDDAADLYRDAAERIVKAGNQALQKSGRFTFVLSGGSTPRRLFALLGSAEYRDRLDWSHTHLFWGDERMVPISDPQSNYRMGAETLLSRVEVPPDNIHRIPSGPTPEEAAEIYEQQLRKFFGADPHFDMVLLGMGADGHTASLFPGARTLGEGKKLAVPAREASPPRVTLTLPALNAAAEIIFLVSGSSKAPALAAVLEGPPDADLPAALVRPSSGNVYWLVDRPAAAFLRQVSSAS